MIINKVRQYLNIDSFKDLVVVVLTLSVIFLMLVGFNSRCKKSSHDKKIDKIRATSIIKSPDSNVSGIIFFGETDDDQVRVDGLIFGLKQGKHGMHVHTKGDLTKGCESLGGHFNPHNKDHGGRLNKDGSVNISRHVGDLGNIYSNIHKIAEFHFRDPLINLSGPDSVIGRSVVIHADEDDLGLGSHPDSKTTGHSGKRVACGIIAHR